MVLRSYDFCTWAWEIKVPTLFLRNTANVLYSVNLKIGNYLRIDLSLSCIWFTFIVEVELMCSYNYRFDCHI